MSGMHRYGDDELELYELVRKLEYNATQISTKLCKKDCKRAAKVQAEEARKKYVEDYEEWEKRQSWAKELGYEEHVPITAEEVEARRKEIEEEKKQRRKTGAHLPPQARPCLVSQHAHWFCDLPEIVSALPGLDAVQQVAKRSTARVMSFERSVWRRVERAAWHASAADCRWPASGARSARNSS